MGEITALFVRKVVAAAGADANDRNALLRTLGLTMDETDVKTMVADTDYYALLERIAEVLDDATSFPLRVGASMRCDDYP